VAFMAAGFFLVLFGKRIFRWLLLQLYDLFIGHNKGSSDLL
jgi:hypothetical protein